MGLNRKINQGDMLDESFINLADNAYSFCSYQETLDLANLRATNPPLGLITVAAMLANDWELRLSDRNVRLENDVDWEWCDLVIF